MASIAFSTSPAAMSIEQGKELQAPQFSFDVVAGRRRVTLSRSSLPLLNTVRHHTGPRIACKADDSLAGTAHDAFDI